MKLGLEELEILRKVSQSEKGSVNKLLVDRKIQRLFHFTDIRNLESIAFQGSLMPLGMLRESNLHFYHLDKRRASIESDGLSLSVSWPNSKMLYTNWFLSDIINEVQIKRYIAVIELNPKVLLKGTHVFFPGNSAMYEKQVHTRLIDFSGITAFENMFKDGHLKYWSRPIVRRKTLNIPISYPTDPQAEIVYYDSISVDEIKRIWLTKEAYDALKLPFVVKAYIDTKIQVFNAVSSFPWNRKPDWEYWRGEKRFLDFETIIEEGGDCGCSSCVPT